MEGSVGLVRAELFTIGTVRTALYREKKINRQTDTDTHTQTDRTIREKSRLGKSSSVVSLEEVVR